MRRKALIACAWGVIAAYTAGLILFIVGIYQCVVYPCGAVSAFFGGSESGVIFLGIFGTIYFLLSVVMVIFVLILFRKANFAALPNLTAFVKVISKASGSYYSNDFINHLDYHLITTYYICFEFPDRSRKILKVNCDTYITILENDTGLLTYKEYGNNTLFIDFQRQS